MNSVSYPSGGDTEAWAWGVIASQAHLCLGTPVPGQWGGQTCLTV